MLRAHVMRPNTAASHDHLGLPELPALNTLKTSALTRSLVEQLRTRDRQRGGTRCGPGQE
jgi:hypothetical protein